MTDAQEKKERLHGSGNGSAVGYKLEARYNSRVLGPLVLTDKLALDMEWRTISIAEGAAPFGVNVPVSYFDRRMLQDASLVSYVAAEAHRWAFLAWLETHRGGGILCVETRLVEVEYRYSYSTKENGVTPAMLCDRRASVSERQDRVEEPPR